MASQLERGRLSQAGDNVSPGEAGPGGKAGPPGPAAMATAIAKEEKGVLPDMSKVERSISQLGWRGRFWLLCGVLWFLLLPFPALLAHKLYTDKIIGDGIKEIAKPGSPAHLVPHPAAKIALRLAPYIDYFLLAEWIPALLLTIFICSGALALLSLMIGIGESCSGVVDALNCLAGTAF
jgi:hypothetical protein